MSRFCFDAGGFDVGSFDTGGFDTGGFDTGESLLTSEVLSHQVLFRRTLLQWYRKNARDLPWRQSTEMYPVLVSEIMLQQTRVEAVIPYFHAFLAKFPTAASLADASEEAVLTAWSGLGYYSRARNLRRAAAILAVATPVDHAEILRLPGVGPYTAGALASICLGAPYAAVDGNVMRVVSRLTNDPSEISAPITKRRFAETAQDLLDPAHPGDFNQAMMELGATICLPAKPRCLVCPVRRFCAATDAGTQATLPVKLGKPQARRVELDLLVCFAAGTVFLQRRSGGESRLPNFWELPEVPAGGLPGSKLQGEFTHQIVNDRYRVRVWLADSDSGAALTTNGRWFTLPDLAQVPVTTVAKKALRTRLNGPKDSRSPPVTQAVQ